MMPIAQRFLVLAAAQALSTTSTSRFSAFQTFLATQQSKIVEELEALDGGAATFSRDAWSRDDGSEGLTRVIEGGALIEKGCVSTSFIRGELTPQRAAAMSGRGRDAVDATGGQRFEAAALSLVLHPRSPHVPTLRGDARCFVVFDAAGEARGAWYGGGCDLTPCYLDEADVAGFHEHWRAACDRHAAGLYARLKRACDDYFYLPFRREHRGVGGIFWDDDAADHADAFARDVLDGMVASWRPIVARHRGDAVAEPHRAWQLLRRGRYVEFNLLNDRGVRFGLSPDAIERVMVSAPPLVAWGYRADPEPGSDEARLLDVLRAPRDWCGVGAAAGSPS